jgi:hypothetical protein
MSETPTLDQRVEDLAAIGSQLSAFTLPREACGDEHN